ncbi:MAG: patatin, partial [Usitatibacter sp.]
AVDLSSDMLGSRLRHVANDKAHVSPITDWMKAHGVASPQARDAPASPSPVDVFVSSMQVMQVRIARTRIAEDPPNLLVSPRVSQLALLDFHRASEAIEEGKRAVERVAAQLQGL